MPLTGRRLEYLDALMVACAESQAPKPIQQENYDTRRFKHGPDFTKKRNKKRARKKVK